MVGEKILALDIEESRLPYQRSTIGIIEKNVSGAKRVIINLRLRRCDGFDRRQIQAAIFGDMVGPQMRKANAILIRLFGETRL
jgi:hypothetical protein